MQGSATGATWEPYVHCNKASAVEKGEKVELNTPGLYRLYRVYCDSEIQVFPISLLKNNIDHPCPPPPLLHQLPPLPSTLSPRRWLDSRLAMDLESWRSFEGSSDGRRSRLSRPLSCFASPRPPTSPQFVLCKSVSLLRRSPFCDAWPVPR